MEQDVKMEYNIFKQKKILITGGTGSLGRELVHDVLKHNSKVVRVFDVDEIEQFEFHHELKEHEDTVRFLLVDVAQEETTRAVEDVDIIFHTKALKHVWPVSIIRSRK
ncbi:MAG: SDR family NAD(P)-dependent oxidoreductase [ANME-2 cluster archaeon]|nr:MAG: SDR family NAD(P)-dependent oxidoreductase [ANME-2 cluster archaeon]